MSAKLSEFDRIAKFFRPLAAKVPGASDLLDDAAVITPAPGKDLVYTKDAMIAGTHFYPDDAPQDIAQKLYRVNLSDLTAKGAKARYYMLSIALPRDIPDHWLAAFTDGLQDAQNRFDMHLIGGDSVSIAGPVALSLTAIGEVDTGNAVRRGGAQPGDLVFVTGNIGDGYLGYRVKDGADFSLSETHHAYLTRAYHYPDIPVAIAPFLQRHAHAAVDVSDGLLADACHIARASHCQMVIYAHDIPYSDAASAVLKTGVMDEMRLLTGGEDYQTVFTLAPQDSAALLSYCREHSVKITQIGAITDRPPGASPLRLMTAAGKPIALPDRLGWMHE